MVLLNKMKLTANAFQRQNILGVPEGSEDLSVQVVAAVAQVSINTERRWKGRWWGLDALKDPLQEGELHQV